MSTMGESGVPPVYLNTGYHSKLAQKLQEAFSCADSDSDSRCPATFSNVTTAFMPYVHEAIPGSTERQGAAASTATALEAFASIGWQLKLLRKKVVADKAGGKETATADDEKTTEMAKDADAKTGSGDVDQAREKTATAVEAKTDSSLGYYQRASSDVLALAVANHLGQRFMANPTFLSVKPAHAWIASIMADLHETTNDFTALKLSAETGLDKMTRETGWHRGRITFTAASSPRSSGTDTGRGKDTTHDKTTTHGKDTTTASVQKMTVSLWPDANYISMPRLVMNEEIWGSRKHGPLPSGAAVIDLTNCD